MCSNCSTLCNSCKPVACWYVVVGLAFVHDV
jgi:hypothetical protein